MYLVKIIKKFVTTDICFIKVDLIDTLIKNQSNTNILDYI
jgi:hypothetical protein